MAQDIQTISYEIKSNNEDICEKCNHLQSIGTTDMEYSFAIDSSVGSIRCPICRMILALLPHQDQNAVLLGQSASTEENDCPAFISNGTVAMLRCSLKREYGKKQQIEVTDSGSTQYLVTQGSRERGYVYFANGDFKEYSNNIGSFLPQDSSQLCPYLQYNVIKNWLDSCESSHDCSKRSNVKADVKRFYIDVVQNCLVESSYDEQYVALSYVRGSVPVFETTRAVISTLRQPGALHPDNCRLNRVFLDSIEVTRKLDERLLWIDAICIPQDEDLHKAALIQQMDLIYSGAALTILAMSGSNADSPLHGVSAPRTSCVSILNASGSEESPPWQCAVRRAHFFREVRDAPQPSRGWTLQETVLPYRSLVFLENRVLFLCGENEIQSDAPVHKSEGKVKWRQMSIHSMRAAKTERQKDVLYMRTVEDYSRRKLTYSSDALNAISGVLAAMSREFGWEFCAGLPMHSLHYSLTWLNPIDKPIRNKDFPSWSWAGWTGGIAMYSFDEIALNDGTLLEPESLADIDVSLKSEASDRIIDPKTASSIKELCITGRTAPLQQFSVRPLEEQETSRFKILWASRIFDKDENHCGFLFSSYSSLGELRELDLQNLHFVSLSRYIFDLKHKSSRAKILDCRRIGRQYSIGEKMEIVNVVLIKLIGDVAERVGAGRFYADSWEKLAGEPKRILLR